MAHTFRFEVVLERVQGKFAPREEMAEAIMEAIEMADVDGIGPDGDSVYEIVDVAEVA